MSEDRVIQFVKEVKANIDQPVTVAETHYWWRDYGFNLAKELDFIGIHIYPLWEGRVLIVACLSLQRVLKMYLKHYQIKELLF